MPPGGTVGGLGSENPNRYPTPHVSVTQVCPPWSRWWRRPGRRTSPGSTCCCARRWWPSTWPCSSTAWAPTTATSSSAWPLTRSTTACGPPSSGEGPKSSSGPKGQRRHQVTLSNWSSLSFCFLVSLFFFVFTLFSAFEIVFSHLHITCVLDFKKLLTRMLTRGWTSRLRK